MVGTITGLFSIAPFWKPKKKQKKHSFFINTKMIKFKYDELDLSGYEYVRRVCFFCSEVQMLPAQFRVFGAEAFAERQRCVCGGEDPLGISESAAQGGRHALEDPGTRVFGAPDPRHRGRGDRMAGILWRAR
jgi:hypothetical protein